MPWADAGSAFTRVFEDLVSFFAETLRIGRTSITVRITVDAKRGHPPHDVVRVTQAEVVYVAIEEPGKAVPVNS
jgi:acyl-CoA thioesterase YciA